MKRSTAKGVEIAYEDLGERGGETRPLVVIHGFTGHRNDFHEVAPELALDRRVIIPDLRGHGDSGRGAADDYRFDVLLDDLSGLLDTLSIDRCDLLGHSMGGMLALRFVLLHPQRVATLILMNTSPDIPDGMTADSMEKGIALAQGKGMDALQAVVERVGRRRDDPILRQWGGDYWTHHRRRYGAMDPAAYAGLGRAMVNQEPVTSRLGEIEQPSLVLVGEGDDEFLTGADQLEAGIRGARRVTIPGAGHHPHQENPDAWLRAVTGHLRAHD